MMIEPKRKKPGPKIRTIGPRGGPEHEQPAGRWQVGAGLIPEGGIDGREVPGGRGTWRGTRRDLV